MINFIWKNGKNLLKVQRNQAKRLMGRHTYKEHHGTHADYHHIYTDNSLKAHLTALKRFSAYSD